MMGQAVLAAGAPRPPARPDFPAGVAFETANPALDPDAYGGANRPASAICLASDPALLKDGAAVVFPVPTRIELVGAAAGTVIETGGTRAEVYAAIQAAVRAAEGEAALDDLAISGAVPRTAPSAAGTAPRWTVRVLPVRGYAGGVDAEDPAAPEFPYKRRFLPDPPEKYLERLRATDYAEVMPSAYARGYRGRRYPPARGLHWRYGCGRRQTPRALVINERAYDEVDVVTDLFTEEARMSAAVEGKPSPLEAWADPDARAGALARAAELVKTPAVRGARVRDRGLHAQREAVWHLAPEATSFKVSLAKAIYGYLGGVRVLDPCAGWGDRMLGAAGAPRVAKYVGLDPNPALVKGHGQIARLVGQRAALDAKVRPIPAEAYTPEMFAADFGDKPPNLVFTSPPFFTYEVYNRADEAQSIARHATVEDWVDGWLLPTMTTMWGYLAPQGYFAVYIADAGGHAVVGPLVDRLSSLGHYCGAIACRRGAKRPVPLFVWRKKAAQVA